MHVGLHHAEKRKKAGKATTFDHFMIVVGIIAPIALIPQAITVWVDRNVGGISLPTWFLLSWVSVMWLIYGAVRKSPALFLSNLLLTVMNIIIITGVLMMR